MRAKLRRKSFFIDEGELRRARKELGTTTDAETIRLALREIARMKSLWRFMQRAAGTVPTGGFSDI